MRYIKFRTSVEKTADSSIESTDDIKALLSSLMTSELNCGIKLYSSPKAEMARILELRENDFRFIAIFKSSSLIRVVEYKEIELLEVYDVSIDSAVKPGISRWMMITPLMEQVDD